MSRYIYMFGSKKTRYNYEDSRIIESLQVEFGDDETKEISTKKINAELVAKNEFDKGKDLKGENIAYRDAQGGICHGLASKSAIEATGQKLLLRAKERKIFVGYNIKAQYDLTNENISDNIRFADTAYWWWTTQERFGSTYSSKVKSVEQVVNAIKDDPAVLLCMSGFKGLSMSGHTVLVSALYKDITSGDYYIEIHDSNMPNSREFILVKEKYLLGKLIGVDLDPCKYEAFYKNFKLFDVYKRVEDLTAEGYFDFVEDTENKYNNSWSIEEDAYLDVDNNLVLTKADSWTSGVAWYKEEINGPFEVSLGIKLVVELVLMDLFLCLIRIKKF